MCVGGGMYSSFFCRFLFFHVNFCVPKRLKWCRENFIIPQSTLSVHCFAFLQAFIDLSINFDLQCQRKTKTINPLGTALALWTAINLYR